MELLKTYLDPIIFGSLFCMSFLALWASCERVLFYRKIEIANYKHIDALKIDLTKNLTLISTIAANAPYVGLIGTVGGILITFWDIGQHGGAISADKIMLGLALALKATALGLVVAIPAVLFYNGLLRKVEVITANWEVKNQ